MKKLIFSFLAGALLLGAIDIACPYAADGQTIIPKDELKTVKGSDEIFTGNVTIQPLYPANGEMRSSGGSVAFEPGARPIGIFIR